MNIEYPFYCIESLYDIDYDKSVDRSLLRWWNEEGFENINFVVFNDGDGATVLGTDIHNKFAINLHFTGGITTFINKGYKI